MTISVFIYLFEKQNKKNPCLDIAFIKQGGQPTWKTRNYEGIQQYLKKKKKSGKYQRILQKSENSGNFCHVE